MINTGPSPTPSHQLQKEEVRPYQPAATKEEAQVDAWVYLAFESGGGRNELLGLSVFLALYYHSMQNQWNNSRGFSTSEPAIYASRYVMLVARSACSWATSRQPVTIAACDWFPCHFPGYPLPHIERSSDLVEKSYDRYAIAVGSDCKSLLRQSLSIHHLSLPLQPLDLCPFDIGLSVFSRDAGTCPARLWFAPPGPLQCPAYTVTSCKVSPHPPAYLTQALPSSIPSSSRHPHYPSPCSSCSDSAHLVMWK